MISLPAAAVDGDATIYLEPNLRASQFCRLPSRNSVGLNILIFGMSICTLVGLLGLQIVVICRYILSPFFECSNSYILSMLILELYILTLEC